MSDNNNFLQVRGFMYKIFDVQSFKNNFTKREFILETREKGRDGKEYKNLTKFNTTKSFTSILDNIGVGSEVVVHFGLDGREWKKADTGEIVHINSLRCWKIDVINNTSQERKEVSGVAQPPQEYEPTDPTDDLPFAWVLPLVGLASAGLTQLLPLLA